VPIEIEGAETTAKVMVDDESLIEQNALEQIRTLADHPAFTEPIRVMPDAHWGAGAPVGFSMPLPDAVVPNVVGVDVGCGMAATNLGDELPLADGEREQRVRAAVPMGRDTHDYDDSVHLVDQFPFERATEAFDQFAAAYRERFDREIDPLGFDFDGYDGEYFKSLCGRVLRGRSQGMGHVIRSAGTLGGGNHFVEFARARESGDYWLVIHSGSRYLGLAVAGVLAGSRPGVPPRRRDPDGDPTRRRTLPEVRPRDGRRRRSLRVGHRRTRGVTRPETTCPSGTRRRGDRTHLRATRPTRAGRHR